jgi:hypothetical protein
MMPSFPAADHTTAAAAAAAATLSPTAPIAVLPQMGGGNNRLYRVDTVDRQSFALKWYARHAGDSRDRLGTEWAALRFFTRHHVANVPRAIAVDVPAGFALYEWIDGDPVGPPRETDIGAALDFLGQLCRLGTADGAETLPLASEACLSAGEILTQIARRAARLASVSGADADLRAFLEDEFAPIRQQLEAAAEQGYAQLGWRFGQVLAPAMRCLSPSDFGFHNALRRSHGGLTFLDFEYFGWDDPVKLTADFLQHPGMSLDTASSNAFRAGALQLFGRDQGFENRLRLTLPLYGLRWCMILLNEFLPEPWRARRFAGQQADRPAATQAQLLKARDRLAKLRQIGMDHVPW